jgi:hypothetical protein
MRPVPTVFGPAAAGRCRSDSLGPDFPPGIGPGAGGLGRID